MKGLIFLKPLEYNIAADGEKWRQGDKIKGLLKLKNHSAERIDLPFLKLSLAAGNFKKIKNHDKRAWENLTETTLALPLTINASEEIEFPWDFVLPEDCQITDKDGSVFLTFQDKAELWPAGQLELVIEPKLIINQFLEIFQNFLRFKIKDTKFSKGMIEIKMTPPSSRELGHIDSLVLRVKEVDKTLDLEYNFNMHVFETINGNVLTQKKSMHVGQKLTSKQFYIYGDSPNQDFIISSVSALIKEATPKFFMSK